MLIAAGCKASVEACLAVDLEGSLIKQTLLLFSKEFYFDKSSPGALDEFPEQSQPSLFAC